MADVYLSYSSDDRDRTRSVFDALQDVGISAFWDQQVPPGASWDDFMREAHEAARAVVVLWSRNSLASRFVRGEARLADEGNKYIPVLLEPFNPVEFPLGLYHSAPLTWFTGAGDEFNVLLAQLEKFGITADANNASRLSGGAAKRRAPQNQGYAFISHVEENIHVVEGISKFLKERGYAYWTYHEVDRDYQKPTYLEIEERLVESRLMLAVLSPEWKKSEWVFRELFFAREIRKPLFLLKFADPGPTLAIAGDTYIDFQRNREDGFRRLGIELDKKGL